MQGSQTHRTSLKKTPTSNRPMGETWIGRQTTATRGCEMIVGIRSPE
jgi:hypothetical protein